LIQRALFLPVGEDSQSTMGYQRLCHAVEQVQAGARKMGG